MPDLFARNDHPDNTPENNDVNSQRNDNRRDCVGSGHTLLDQDQVDGAEKAGGQGECLGRYHGAISCQGSAFKVVPLS